MAIDRDAFRDFEQRGWEEVGDDYASSDIVLGLTGQAADAMVTAVGARSGRRILDLACGPGLASEVANERGADVVGVDVAAAMVAAARKRVSGATFHQGPAEDLPFDDDSFHGVTCGFGLPHFAEPETVLSEVHRVLAPAGALACTTWCAPDEVPFFGIVFEAVAEHGSFDVDIPDGPDMFRFASGEEAEATLGRLGFRAVSVTTLSLSARLRDPSEAVDLLLKSTVRTRSLVEAQTPEARSAIAAAVVEAVGARRDGDGDGLTVPMPAVLITATVP